MKIVLAVAILLMSGCQMTQEQWRDFGVGYQMGVNTMEERWYKQEADLRAYRHQLQRKRISCTDTWIGTKRYTNCK